MTQISLIFKDSFLNKYSLIRRLLIIALLSLNPVIAMAWGERGHDIITRVAVQNLRDITDQDDAIMQPFRLRDHMLSHLSNTPDIVWRSPSMSDQERALNYPTHYINLERVYPKVESISDLDLSYREYAQRAKSNGVTQAGLAGSVPWRILELHKLMVDSFSEADEAISYEQMVDATNKALVYGGIMSHFVADMANPHHTTANHDGQLTGNTGLHAYFESAVVMALPFNLIQKVNAKTGRKLIKKNMMKALSRSEFDAALNSPSNLVFSLLVNSHLNLPKLTKLDDKHSIIERSLDEKTKAKRKPPAKVMRKYEPFVVERLALGASVLAQLWLTAWRAGGSPDLTEYRSYDYPVAPEFITPSYQQNTKTR